MRAIFTDRVITGLQKI